VLLLQQQQQQQQHEKEAFARKGPEARQACPEFAPRYMCIVSSI